MSGKLEVEQHEVVRLAGQLERLDAGLDPRRPVALGGQGLPQASTQGDVVLHHQDPSAVHHDRQPNPAVDRRAEEFAVP